MATGVAVMDIVEDDFNLYRYVPSEAARVWTALAGEAAPPRVFGLGHHVPDMEPWWPLITGLGALLHRTCRVAATGPVLAHPRAELDGFMFEPLSILADVVGAGGVDQGGVLEWPAGAARQHLTLLVAPPRCAPRWRGTSPAWIWWTSPCDWTAGPTWSSLRPW